MKIHRAENAIVRTDHYNYEYDNKRVIDMNYYYHHDLNDLSYAYMIQLFLGNDEIILIKGNTLLKAFKK